MALNRSAIFLDKDGTLIDDLPFNVDPARVRLAAGAGKALRLLQHAGYRLIAVTNQPGIGQGRYDSQALAPVWDCIARQLAAWQVRLDGHYVCPHVPQAGCSCRKPQPGMLLQAAEEHGIALAGSWMIGDILHDVEAGHRAGCRAVLVDCGNETEWRLSPLRIPDVVAPNLHAAAAYICHRERRRT